MLKHFILILLCLCSTSLVFADNTEKAKVAQALAMLNKSKLQDGSCAVPKPLDNPFRDDAADWSRAGFGNPIISTLELDWDMPNPPVFTHEISFTMVQFRNTGWSEDEIKQRFLRIAQIYSQCGIKVGKSKLVTAYAPNNWIDTDFGLDKLIDLRMAQMTPQTLKPIIYYVRTNKQNKTAYSWNLSTEAGPHLTDTVWMTADTLSPGYLKVKPEGYSEEAHELGHLYGNCEHTVGNPRNFLSGKDPSPNDKILPEQCESMKKHPLVRPL